MRILRDTKFTTVFLYGVSHLIVDAASLSCYFTLLNFYGVDYWTKLIIFLSYGIIAFAMQSPIGLLSDYFNRPVLISVIGCLLVAASPFFVSAPIFALLVVGVGNSFFHVGGGIITLSLSQGRAAMSGFFIAPGTIGVVIGISLGKTSIDASLLFAVILLTLSIIMLTTGRTLWRITNTTNAVCSDSKRTKIVVPLILIAIVLIFLTIIMRSLLSTVSNSSDNVDAILLYAISAAIFVGKMCGGVLADYFGWRYFLTISLCLSAFLFYVSTYYTFHTFKFGFYKYANCVLCLNFQHIS
jgi:FSR family fosmidomycin resistance protein-like MFS transporter